MTATILVLHALSTFAMVGLIWFVQLVHYPPMAQVTAVSFSQFGRYHQRWTIWVVMAVMLLEAGIACLLPFMSSPILSIIGLLLLVLVWLSAFLLIQVPCHSRLAEKFDVNTHRWLVQSNWVRTVLWSIRGGLVVWMMLLTCSS